MSVLSLSVVRATGEVVYAAEQEDEVTLAWRGEYLPGDKLVVRCDTHPVRLVLRLDASLAESHVLMTEDSFEFPIPLGCRQKAYGKGWAFEGDRHFAYVRREDPREAAAWRNLSLNACDCEDMTGVYPHVTSNVPMDNPQFVARNVIDGVMETSNHGSWPHESWSVAGRADAWLKIDFGEPVNADELRLFCTIHAGARCNWSSRTVLLPIWRSRRRERGKRLIWEGVPFRGSSCKILSKSMRTGFPG